MTTTERLYSRVVIKVSGESLGDGAQNIVAHRYRDVAAGIADVYHLGVDVVVVVGGGNLFRGFPHASSEWAGFDHAAADEAGMVATGLNAKLLAGHLTPLVPGVEIFSRGPCVGMGTYYTPAAVCATLDEGKVVVLAGGMGTGGVSTDVPAVFAAIDVDADAVIMAKHGVDGVYDSDPRENPRAAFLPELEASFALATKINVMDTSALALARDHGKTIHVIPATEMSGARYIIEGKEVGSTIQPA